ncbi:hypothetical protein ACJ73_01810 [Blastomyces percursus]|uniref:CCHC-type domain-containing protein n=1 Tax=Blastomyces percursus TaxID=1658174 RepID=A0A1J9QEA2_9EURO|nr:hypothetical protein ACJ73_01810 [Blastomyces percursus]
MICKLPLTCNLWPDPSYEGPPPQRYPPSHRDYLLLLYLNLDSSVQAMVLPQAEEAGTWDYNSILDQLRLIAKFERVLYEARAQDWLDTTKISFRQGLSYSIRNRLSQQLNLPRTYEDFLKVVQQLSSNSTSSTSQHPNQTSRNDPMDLNAIQINAIRSDSRLADLAALEAPNSKAPSISSAQRDKLRSEGRCVRCGSSDHWIDNCPFLPYRSPSAKSNKPIPHRRQMAFRIPASQQGSDLEDNSDWEKTYEDLLNGN